MKHKTAKANVKTKTRLLSLLLAVLMTLFCFPVTAIGTDEAEEPISETLEETADAGLSAFERGVGELSPEALESMTLNAADVPEVISAQAIAEKDHVLRLREQEENLNTVVFQNRDGGKTVYLYANPVKYVDANRNVKDKSTALKAENITLNGKTYSHSATENVFGQYYPTMPQNGVLITFGQYTVEMAPVITGILTLRDTAVANNKVTYNKVFGNGTSLVYTPTLSGVKEDIILQTYTGKSSFSFTLKTNGLAIVQTESDTFLADFEGNKVASLGKVIITDRANHTAYGSMTVAAKNEREEYTVTVNAPVEFLTSNATVYPVTVDPTLTIDEEYCYLDDYGNELFASAIEDLCIYQGSVSPGHPYSTIGNLEIDEEGQIISTARMLYRIKNNYASIANLDYYIDNRRFNSASLNIKACVTETEVKAKIYPFCTTWENGTITDCSIGTENQALYSMYNNTICTSTSIDNISLQTISLNITEILRYYSTQDIDCREYGFLLKLEGEGNFDSELYQQFKIYQTEYTNFSTYISINYSSSFSTDDVFSCYRFVLGESLCLDALTETSIKARRYMPASNASSTLGCQLWILDKAEGNYYYIYSLGIRTENYTDKYVLTAGTNGSITLTEFANINSQKWEFILDSSTGLYKIYNKQFSNKAICLTTSSISLSENNYTLLSIENATDLFDCFWEGTYTKGVTASTINIKVTIDPSAYVGNITSSVLESLEYWEQVNPKIKIYMPDEYNIPTNSFPVIVAGKSDFSDDNTLAEIQPRYNGARVNGHSDWDICYIYINTNANSESCLYNKSVEIINKTLMHEMGHVLKLCHLEDVYGNTAMLSIMNSIGINYINYPGWLDAISIKNKWG